MLVYPFHGWCTKLRYFADYLLCVKKGKIQHYSRFLWYKQSPDTGACGIYGKSHNVRKEACAFIRIIHGRIISMVSSKKSVGKVIKIGGLNVWPHEQDMADILAAY